MTQKITIVDRLEWSCDCADCADEEGGYLTTRAEYFTDKHGDREIEILDTIDCNHHLHIQLPAGYAICKIEEATE
jgi:hypothetical protein